jgi:hypothetical protein
MIVDPPVTTTDGVLLTVPLTGNEPLAFGEIAFADR